MHYFGSSASDRLQRGHDKSETRHESARSSRSSGIARLNRISRWSFDFDGEDAMTVTIQWGSGVVKEIKTLAPFGKTFSAR